MVDHQCNITQIDIEANAIVSQTFDIEGDLAFFESVDITPSTTVPAEGVLGNSTTKKRFDVAVSTSGSTGPSIVNVRYRTIEIPENVGPGFAGDTIDFPAFFDDIDQLIGAQFFVFPRFQRNGFITYDCFYAFQPVSEADNYDLHVATLQSPPGEWEGFVDAPGNVLNKYKTVLRHTEGNVRVYDVFLLTVN